VVLLAFFPMPVGMVRRHNEGGEHSRVLPHARGDGPNAGNGTAVP